MHRSRSPPRVSEEERVLQSLAAVRKGKRGADTYISEGLEVPASLIRRREQVERRFTEIETGVFRPRRDQQVLPDLSDSEVGSQVAEVIVIESSSEEERDPRSVPRSQRPPEPAGPPPGWAPASSSSRSSGFVSPRATVRVTSSNPLLRRLAEPASPEYKVIPIKWNILSAGVDIRPRELPAKLHHSLVFSIDWHGVLDIKRSVGRPRPVKPAIPYTLLAAYRERLERLKQLGVWLLINCCTNSPWFKNSVHSLADSYPNLFDFIVTTKSRRGEGGKFCALNHII